MHIELKKLKVHEDMSEETTAYTAEVHVNGKLAFYASNRGHGDADHFRPVGAVTEADVNAWLKANRPAAPFGEWDLEWEVGRRIDLRPILTALKKGLVVTTKGEKFFTRPAGGRPGPGETLVTPDNIWSIPA